MVREVNFFRNNTFKLLLSVLVFASLANIRVTPAQGKDFFYTVNTYRCKHDSQPLMWDTALYENTVSTFDKKRKMAHSDCYNIPLDEGGPSGENLALGFYSPGSTVGAWYNEVRNCITLPGCGQGIGESFT